MRSPPAEPPRLRGWRLMSLSRSERRMMPFGVRRMIAEARIEREKRLAELEALAGIDIETFKPTTRNTQPMSGK